MTDTPKDTEEPRENDSVQVVIRPDPNAPDYRVDPVPKVPRRIGYRWAFADIVRIVFLGGLLALIIVARKPCSESVANFVDTFEEADAAPAADDPRNWKLERLTDEQLRQRFSDGGLAPGDAGSDAGQVAPE